jgi:hypothetical protein
MNMYNVWVVGDKLIIEITDRDSDTGARLLYETDVAPFRKLTVADISPYTGKHPRTLAAQPLQKDFYSHYGFEKSTETASSTLHIRVTPGEMQSIKDEASSAGVPYSDYVREKIFRA